MITQQDIEHLQEVVSELRNEGRHHELLDIIGVPTLHQLNLEAAKASLSPLVISSDYRFFLPAYQKEVLLPPIHKALYLLFLRHPEGIESKCLIDYEEELTELYRSISTRSNDDVIRRSIARLVNPLDNSLNEKSARIKSTFAMCMDQYQLSYYAISCHSVRHIDGSSRIWFERKKTITLPRELVSFVT